MSEQTYITGAHRRAVEAGHTEDELLEKLDALLVISNVFDSEHIAELFAIYFTSKIFHNMNGVRTVAKELDRLQLHSRADQLHVLTNELEEMKDREPDDPSYE